MNNMTMNRWGTCYLAAVVAVGCTSKAESKYSECVALETSGEAAKASAACEAAIMADPHSEAGKHAAEKLRDIHHTRSSASPLSGATPSHSETLPKQSPSAPVTPPTAAAASATTKTREADRAVMIAIPAGPFTRGSVDGEDNEHPPKQLTLSALWIDKTEVNVAAYKKCIAAKACSPASTATACNQGDPNKDDHPINCVRWDQADAYCKWAGARLPTEAEWEKAARGTDGRVYPWGNQPPSCSLAVWYDTDSGHGCGEHGTWTAGTKPAGASPYGALDMAGNVWEWVADPYNPGYYAIAPDNDPKGPDKGAFRILRGGGWGNDGPGKLRSAGRFRFGPSNQTPSTGFRCAMSASEEDARSMGIQAANAAPQAVQQPPAAPTVPTGGSSGCNAKCQDGWVYCTAACFSGGETVVCPERCLQVLDECNLACR